MTNEQQKAEWAEEDRLHEIHKLFEKESADDHFRDDYERLLAWEYFLAGHELSRAAALEEASIAAAIHSQYPIETEFDRGYAKARRDAANKIHALARDGSSNV